MVDYTQPHPSIIDKGAFKKTGRAAWYKAYSCLPHNPDHVWCNVCGEKLQCSSFYGTASVIKHLQFRHTDLYNFLKDSKTPTSTVVKTASGGKTIKVESTDIKFKDGSTASRSSSRRRSPSAQSNTFQNYAQAGFNRITQEDKKVARQRALETQTLYLVCNGRPFTDANNPEFREMLSAAAEAGAKQTNFFFSPDQIREVCSSLASEVRSDLKERIKGKQVTATFDHWTSRAKDNFSCLTLHWIENFKLEHAVVTVYKYSGETTGQEIAKDFLRKLKEYGVHDTCKFFVTDTTASMNLVGHLLENRGFQHVYCTAHVVQLITKLAFEAKIFPAAHIPAAAAAAAPPPPPLDDDGGGKPAAVDLQVDDPANKQDDLKMEAVDQEEGNAKNVLWKARRIVAYFSRSTQALDELRQNYTELWDKRGGDPEDKLPERWILLQDVITRWWSTYTMLDRLLKPHVQQAISRYYSDNNGFKKTQAPKKIEDLTLDDWAALRQMKTLLKPFKDSQLQLEASKYVTSSLTPVVAAMLQNNLRISAEVPEDEGNRSVLLCAREMKADFNGRFGDIYFTSFTGEVERGDQQRQTHLHPAFYIAHALDPRFKKLLMFKDQQIKEDIWDHILELMIDEREKWEKRDVERQNKRVEALQQAKRSGVPATVTTMPDNPGLAELARDMQAQMEQHPDEPRRESPTRTSIRVNMTQQLDNYKRMAGLGNEWDPGTAHLYDPLMGWWKTYAASFPQVWTLAERYLAIPATSAPSERAFSSAGIVLSMRRCRLKPNLLDDSVLLRKNRHIVQKFANIDLYEEYEEEGYAPVQEEEQEEVAEEEENSTLTSK